MGNAGSYRESETRFDRDGNVVKEVLFDPSGSVIRSVDHTHVRGLHVRETHRDGSGKELLVKDFEYKHQKLSRIEVKGMQPVATIEYAYQDSGEYDEITVIGGQHKHQKHWDCHGKLLWEVNLTNGNRTDYAYDEKGSLTEVKEEHGEGHTSLRYKNEYDGQGNLVKVITNGRLTSEFVYDGALIVREIRYAPEGHAEAEMCYQYEFM